jgi:hypothetical protein
LLIFAAALGRVPTRSEHGHGVHVTRCECERACFSGAPGTTYLGYEGSGDDANTECPTSGDANNEPILPRFRSDRGFRCGDFHPESGRGFDSDRNSIRLREDRASAANRFLFVV